MSRKLATDEQALWARIVASVNPLRGRQAVADSLPRPPPPRPQPAKASPGPVPAAQPQLQPTAGGLDKSWDHRLARGLVRPDMVVDLHGHDLAGAHSLLREQLEVGISLGARVILLITGKPPQAERRPVGRGAIRAAVGDWLAASGHAGDIAAIRAAHPRHGGSGALYIILRRRVTRNRQKS